MPFELEAFAPAEVDTQAQMRNGGRVKGHDEWLTPPGLIRSLGPFDLDPCAPTVRPWPTATRHIAPPENGLLMRWDGRVWMNPPFSQNARWIGRLAQHGNGIALVPARTDSRWFQEIAWPNAAAALFLRGRQRFYKVDGSIGAFGAAMPLVLFAFGESNRETLLTCGISGLLWSAPDA